MPLEPVIYELAEPAQAHGEQITRLTLRPIRGEDIAACGYPFTIKNLGENDDNPEIEFHGPAMLSLIARIAEVPRSTIAHLPAKAVFELGYLVVQLFLGVDLKASSNSASILPGSGDRTHNSSSSSTSTN